MVLVLAAVVVLLWLASAGEPDHAWSHAQDGEPGLAGVAAVGDEHTSGGAHGGASAGVGSAGGPELRVAALGTISRRSRSSRSGIVFEDPWRDGLGPGMASARGASQPPAEPAAPKPEPWFIAVRDPGEARLRFARGGARARHAVPGKPLIRYDVNALVASPAKWPAVPLAGAWEDGVEPESGLRFVGVLYGPRAHETEVPLGDDLLLARVHRILAEEDGIDEQGTLAPGTLLGVAHAHRDMIVRATAAAHERIRALLDDWDRRARRTVQVGFDGVRVRPALSSFARGVRGRLTPYVMDVDVEIAGTSFISDPILGTVESGVGVCAQRFMRDGEEYVRVAVARAPLEPRFRAWSTSLAGGFSPVTIELPIWEGERWTRTIALPDHAEGFVHRVELAPGAVVVIACEPRPAETREATRLWSMRVHTTKPEPKRGNRLRVVGSRSGSLGTLAWGGDGGFADEELVLRTPPAKPSAVLDQALRSDRAALGCTVLHVARQGTLGGTRVIELALAVGMQRSETREAVSLPYRGLARPWEVAVGALPIATYAVDTARIVLDADGAGRASFIADLGQGRERIDVVVERAR